MPHVVTVAGRRGSGLGSDALRRAGSVPIHISRQRRSTLAVRAAIAEPPAKVFERKYKLSGKYELSVSTLLLADSGGQAMRTQLLQPGDWAVRHQRLRRVRYTWDTAAQSQPFPV